MRGKKLAITASLTILCLAGAFFYRGRDNIAEVSDKTELMTRLLHSAASNVHSRWEKGDDDGKWGRGQLTCDGLLGKAQGADSSYLKCNPNFLACWYRYHVEEVEHKGEKYKFGVEFPSGNNLPFKRVSTDNSSALLALIKYGSNHEKYFKISLLDTCSEVYLPRRYYAYGKYQGKDKDWRWDNLSRDIFVDKYQVANRDIWEWVTNSDYKDKVDYGFDFTEFTLPATKLSIKQMRDYCSYQGKQLLQAHVFDAASYYVGDIKDATPLSNVRGNYPWTRSAHTAFSDSDGEIFPSGLCYRIFTKECLQELPYNNFSDDSISWSGISQVLGGIMEVQRNPYHGRENVMPSSYHYHYNSPVQQLGHRAFWDGEGNMYKDFNFRGHSPPGDKGPYALGFRCMRLVNG